MECKEYSELISAYIDDSLSLEEEERLLAHLKKCQICQQEVSALKQMKEMLVKLEEVEIPPNFHDDLMKQINKEKKVSNSLKWKWQYGGALAAACFAGFLCLGEIGKLDTGDKGIGEGIAAVEAVPYTINQRSQESAAQDFGKTKAGSESLQKESVCWEINTEDSESLIEDLSVYLEKEQIDFEIKENEMICYQIKEPEKLSNWIKSHVKGFKGEIPYEMSDIDIKII